MVTYTVPGLKTETAERVIELLQDRLNSLNDLALTLKHVHWNGQAGQAHREEPQEVV